MSRKLVAILACRNGGSRLYAKPLQNLGSKKQITVIEYLIKSLKKFEIIEDIGLAISEKKENFIYKEIDGNMHIVNAVSPAFTSCFALSEFIVDKLIL